MCFAIRLDDELMLSPHETPNPTQVELAIDASKFYFNKRLQWHVCKDRHLFLSDFVEMIPPVNYRGRWIVGQGSVDYTAILHGRRTLIRLNACLYVPNSQFNFISRELFERCYPNERGKELRQLQKYLHDLDATIRGPDAESKGSRAKVDWVLVC
jgi:hypothetical protein